MRAFDILKLAKEMADSDLPQPKSTSTPVQTENLDPVPAALSDKDQKAPAIEVLPVPSTTSDIPLHGSSEHGPATFSGLQAQDQPGISVSVSRTV